MPRTLQELTLALSRDISRLQRRCRNEARRLEDDRWRALRALPSAERPVESYDNDLDKATAARESGLVKAREREETALRKATRAREVAFEEAEREFHDTDPFPARREAERAAERDYRAALAMIDRTVARLQQPVQRRAARRALLAAKHRATIEYHRAARRAQDRRRATQREALGAEHSARRAAHDAAELAARAVERVCATAVRRAERRLDAALATLAGAVPVETSYTQARAALRARCRADEHALIDTFRCQRDGIE